MLIFFSINKLLMLSNDIHFTCLYIFVFVNLLVHLSICLSWYVHCNDCHLSIDLYINLPFAILNLYHLLFVFICLFVHLSVCLDTYSVIIAICLLICTATSHLLFSTSIIFCLCLSGCWGVCLFVCLSVCLDTYSVIIAICLLICTATSHLLFSTSIIFCRISIWSWKVCHQLLLESVHLVSVVKCVLCYNKTK